MNKTAKTLHHLSEKDLARYQFRQAGNSCSFHAIATALSLLLDQPRIDPYRLSDEVDRLWWRGRLMRVLPGWAVTPRMQVRIVKHLSQTRQLPITARYQKGDPAALPPILSIPESVPLITLIWLPGQAPPIYLGSSTKNLNTSRSAGGHSMILGAYDPDHHSGDQLATPWGFVNPWKDNATHLFWMTDADFQKAWRFFLPFNGPNPLVLIRRSS